MPCTFFILMILLSHKIMKEGNTMKILITGANGMLAKSVKSKLANNDLICTDVADLDITNKEAVMKIVKNTKPEYIINCAAFTAVDKAETAGPIVEKINAEGPKTWQLQQMNMVQN